MEDLHDVQMTELPPLPDRTDPATLPSLDETALTVLRDELAQTRVATTALMAPYEQHLAEIRARLAEIATEQRRRERAERTAQRRAVREHATSGVLPTLIDALADSESPHPDTMPLAEIAAFLTTGGEVRFGYPTRPGTMAFTDGRQHAQATTWGEARELYARGWEPGIPSVPGVRVHLVGTKIERVVAADGIVVGGESA